MNSLARILGDFGFRFLERAHSDFVAPRELGLRTRPSKHDQERNHGDERYRLTVLRSCLHRAVGALPPNLREKAAEQFLRRTGLPGPAAEHVFQYLLSAEKAKEKGRAGHLEEATVAKGADNFYERQYRQYFNATMGAFALTAKMAFVCSGGAPRGWLWGRRRRSMPRCWKRFAARRRSSSSIIRRSPCHCCYPIRGRMPPPRIDGSREAAPCRAAIAISPPAKMSDARNAMCLRVDAARTARSSS